MKSSFGIVYKVTNKINGKIYIGQTVCGLSKRKSQHFYDAKTKNTSGAVFLRALSKYKRSDFSWQKVCDCCSREDLDYKENLYIQLYDSNNLEAGYNLVTGKGSSGYKLSKEAKNKISVKALERLSIPENNPMYGKKHSDQTKKLISSTHKGRFTGKNNPFFGKKHTDESKRKMSLSRSGEKNHFYNKNLDEGHRNKISESLKGRKFSEEHKKNLSEAMIGKYLGRENKTSGKYIVTKPSGGEIKVHGLSAFCRHYALSQAHMSSCATGKRKSHKGYKCRHYNKEIDLNLSVWEVL